MGNFAERSICLSSYLLQKNSAIIFSSVVLIINLAYPSWNRMMGEDLSNCSPGRLLEAPRSGQWGNKGFLTGTLQVEHHPVCLSNLGAPWKKSLWQSGDMCLCPGAWMILAACWWDRDWKKSAFFQCQGGPENSSTCPRCLPEAQSHHFPNLPSLCLREAELPGQAVVCIRWTSRALGTGRWQLGLSWDGNVASCFSSRE